MREKTGSWLRAGESAESNHLARMARLQPGAVADQPGCCPGVTLTRMWSENVPVLLDADMEAETQSVFGVRRMQDLTQGPKSPRATALQPPSPHPSCEQRAVPCSQSHTSTRRGAVDGHPARNQPRTPLAPCPLFFLGCIQELAEKVTNLPTNAS